MIKGATEELPCCNGIEEKGYTDAHNFSSFYHLIMVSCPSSVAVIKSCCIFTATNNNVQVCGKENYLVVF